MGKVHYDSVLSGDPACREYIQKGVERGIEASFAGSDARAGALRRESELFWQAGMFWDNLNAEWNDWVVKFDSASQESVLSKLGFDDPDWRAFATA